LNYAAFKGHFDMCKLLLKNGAKLSINKLNNDGLTPLFCAALNGYLGICKLLLEHGAKESINIRQKEG
jgi:ankyrin repeat protein